MKSRGGFVSNSSSSSFVLYGAYFTPTEKNKEFMAFFNELVEAGEITLDEGETFEDVIENDPWSVYEAIAGKVGLEYAGGSGEGDPCFGLSPQSFKDDETGLQFKQRAQAGLQALGAKDKASWHEETYYS